MPGMVEVDVPDIDAAIACWGHEVLIHAEAGDLRLARFSLDVPGQVGFAGSRAACDTYEDGVCHEG